MMLIDTMLAIYQHTAEYDSVNVKLNKHKRGVRSTEIHT